MIQVQNLSKTYRTQKKSGNFLTDLLSRKYEEKKALDSINFEIGENELVGFIGPNGAGKTTTMKILSGILYPTSGHVRVLGYTPFEKDHAFLKQIGFVMGQKNQLLWELPATDSFELYKKIYELSDSDYQKSVSELTSLLHVTDILNQPIKTLSLGQRMRMELIAALLYRPKILFLDEPTIGLDIFAQTTIRNFIKEYQERHKATIILTSHYMQDVQHLAKRVLLINNGQILFDGQLKELVEKHSYKKIVTITLDEKLKDESVVKKFSAQYDHPMLRIHLKKSELESTLPKLLHAVEFSDVSIEDEPIEDIIKKAFK